MVDILLLQTVSIALASASVVVGVVYYAVQIRHQNKIRQTELVNTLYSSTRSREYLEAYETVTTREIPESLPEYKKKYGFVELNMVLSLFDQAGILFRKSLIDDELVQYFFGDIVTSFWEKHKHLFENEEKRTGRPHIWKATEDLYNEMKKREQKLQQSKT